VPQYLETVFLKFAHDTMKIMPLIYPINDTNLLKAVKPAVITTKNAE
jgi:hypothetical protein